MCLLLPPIPQKRNQGVDYDELVSTWGKDGADHLLYINDLRSQCQTRADAIAHMPHAKRWVDSAEAMKWADLVTFPCLLRGLGNHSFDHSTEWLLLHACFMNVLMPASAWRA